MNEETCPHIETCRTRQLYWDLCYLNMNEKERKAVGGSCPVKSEYDNVPEETPLVAPSGLHVNFRDAEELFRDKTKEFEDRETWLRRMNRSLR